MPFVSINRDLFVLQLVDINSEEDITKANQIGEVRGWKTIMRSYLGNPEAMAEAFDKQGCYKMGDLAYLYEEGNLFIVDRIKEMLKYKGFQVSVLDREVSVSVYLPQQRSLTRSLPASGGAQRVGGDY